MKRILWVTILILTTLNATGPPLSEDIVRQERIKSDEAHTKQEFIQSLDTLQFSRDNFYQAMVYLDIKHPEILFKQSIVESGNFSSPFWVNCNNPYGMHFPSSRPTTAIGYVWGDFYNGAHAKISVFRHWSDAIRDMKMFQDYWISKGWDIDQVSNYYVFLTDLPYATASHYLKAVNNIQLDNYINQTL